MKITKTMPCALTILGCLSALSGCGGPLVLQVEDVVTMPGKQTRFYAWLGKGHTLAFKRDVADAPVRFYVNGNLVGQAKTDRDGEAVLTCTLPPTSSNQFKATTSVGELTAEARGDFFHWSNDKTIVAVDIDDTVSDTDYSDLFISFHDEISPPIGNSRDVLDSLAQDYQIYYFSARPRFLHDKTRQWLKANGYPMGPIAHASSFEACLRQTTYKRRMLNDLRARYPNMLIGIGDRDVDDKAFNSSQMLTILVNASRWTSYSPQCVLRDDWNGVHEFFNTHQRHLADPRRLNALIARSAKPGTPVIIGEPAGPRPAVK